MPAMVERIMSDIVYEITSKNIKSNKSDPAPGAIVRGSSQSNPVHCVTPCRQVTIVIYILVARSMKG
jgi:hypothetical protein